MGHQGLKAVFKCKSNSSPSGAAQPFERQFTSASRGALFPSALEFFQHFSLKNHPLKEQENTSGIMGL